MTDFRKPGSAQPLESVSLPLRSSVDLILWGAGPNGEKLVVAVDDPLLGQVVEQTRYVGPNRRLFRLTALAGGTCRLEASVSVNGLSNSRQVRAALTVVVPNHYPLPHSEPASNGDDPEAEKLAWDIFQFALDIVGFADPTGIADAFSGLVSVGRGEYYEAAISGLSMIPYIGDLAKVGKLRKYANSVTSAIKLASRNAKFAAALRPALQKVLATLKRVPIDKLPSGAADYIQQIKKEIEAFLDGTNQAVARAVNLGQIAFSGLIKNRPLRSLTHQQIRNAFAQVGLREAHNAHFIMRLLERGPAAGIKTLDDFARALNKAEKVPGEKGTVYFILPGRGFKVVTNGVGELITFSGA
jgi:hypothetical protein